MIDFISREDALMAVCAAALPDKTADGLPIANGKRSVVDCVRRIKAIPAAAVVEAVEAKWEDIDGVFWLCSNCKHASGRTPFCAWCGADMRGET